MTKRVLDVGNCGPDHAAIRRLVEGSFDAVVVQAHGPEDALAALEKGDVDLVLVNRKLDRDYSDGLEVIKQIKASSCGASAPVMMITNYPDHQRAAVEAGAVTGFGKLELQTPQTLEKLRAILG